MSKDICYRDSEVLDVARKRSCMGFGAERSMAAEVLC